MTLMDLITRARETRDPASMAEAMPYARWMGMAPEISTGEFLTRMRFSERIVGNPSLPAVHGGAIGALLETAAIYQLLWESETVALPKIINITVDYLRSARPLDTLARAAVTKQGRRVVNVEIVAWQDDRAKPVASAQAHFLVTPG
jgi:uncharacterized protein (TIGR00369 family)